MDKMSDDHLEIKVKRYLHYGNEGPVYEKGDRFFHKSFSRDKIPSLIKLAEAEDPERVIELILKVKNDGRSEWPDTITYALAYCTCSNNSKLQNAAYKNLRVVCRTSRDILLFVKFIKDKKAKDDKRGTASGTGFKKAIAQWYLSWMPFDLADILLEQKKSLGWTHKDVLRLAHVKPHSIEQQVLFAYTIKGVDYAKKEFKANENEQVKDLLEYIAKVESLRKVKDPVEAAERLALELHTIKRIPTALLQHQEVWDEIIPFMDVTTLLDNFQRISILGFIRSDVPGSTVGAILDVLRNRHKAEEFRGHPIRVYMELKTYCNAALCCLERAEKFDHSFGRTSKSNLPAPNDVITRALGDYYSLLLKLQTPTNLRYLLAVDVGPTMLRFRVDGCHLCPLEVAAAMCCTLNTVEDCVTIGSFIGFQREFHVKTYNKDSKIEDYFLDFHERMNTSGPAHIASAVQWANKNKKPFDVIIVFSNSKLITAGTRNAIKEYRADMNLPNTKLVTCCLTGKLQSTELEVGEKNMLFVAGFDEHVPRLIEAFAKGAF